MAKLGGGTQLITADGVVGEAGKPIRIKALHILSTATPAVVALRAGTTASGTIQLQETGTASTGKLAYYGETGFFFPTGCFVDVDANTTSCLVSFDVD